MQSLKDLLQNKALIDALNKGIDYVLQHDAPDGPYFYDHVPEHKDIETAIACAQLCDTLLVSRQIENAVGFICRIPVDFPRDNYSCKYAGWDKAKDRIYKLLDFHSGRITFYNYSQPSRFDIPDEEFHRQRVTDFFPSVNKDLAELYYIEIKSPQGEYLKYLYVVYKPQVV